MSQDDNRIQTPETQPEEIIERAPDQLEHAMVVIDLKAWIAIATLLIVLVATLIWAFFGTMPLRENVTGVLVRSGRTISFYAPEDTTILDLSIERNDYVNRDQAIARIDQSHLVDQINMKISEDAPADEIALLRAELLESSQIVSYLDGRVQDVFVHAGDYVTKGTKLATMLHSPDANANLECLLYVPIDQIHEVTKGMKVNVFPDFADKNTYGNMFGTVESISEYPVTESYLNDVLGNDELALSFMNNSACYEVKVSLVTSEETTTGYRWTISKGPDVEIGNLSLCNAAIVLSEKRPIDVFFLN
ncbi:HlyD family efflux transporter periplasmic adaptor subunit [Eubacteriales bacterium OttesenSCG-928-N13]|nr:HlyD family efflux transporter periplasmic adaptor subunit [Eubacteriales bacterium OttesenSCG-928-N13]